MTFFCPRFFENFCGVEPTCPNSCTASGTCEKGVCKCFEGFTGADCKSYKFTSSEVIAANKTTLQNEKAGKCVATDIYIKNSKFGEVCCKGSGECCRIYSSY